jgi:glutamyl/glutaminyl-tRNA synthetase
MKILTRFCPTCNGRLHIGHLYMALLNAQADEMIVRFDDNQAWWMERIGRDGIAASIESIKEDIEWIGLKPRYTYNSHEEAENDDLIACRLGPLDRDIPDGRIQWANLANGRYLYPYCPYLTAQTVAQDYREGCTRIIRGDDLLTQHNLYCHFCRVLGLPFPEQFYVPRLMQADSGKMRELTDISKTAGNHKISDYRRAGWTADQLVSVLALCCLVDPARGWRVDNVKEHPVVAWDGPA